MAKELVPIILSTATWGPQLYRSQVCYHCDNSISVVAAFSKGSAHDAVVMVFIAHYDICSSYNTSMRFVSGFKGDA